jgi:hypothetical protein
MGQCECIRTKYLPFICGGNPTQKKRCENKATIKVFGKTPEEKKTPHMELCDECYANFKESNPEYETEKITE